MTKRSIFDELMDGIAAMGEHREGKRTLRTHEVEAEAPPPVDGAYIRATRDKLNMSVPVFARCLRVSPRTLERWEQGQSPGAAAQVLVGLVRRYPDTLGRIAKLETGPKPRGAKAASRRKPSRERRRARRPASRSSVR